jgi:hypothetical protein
MPAEMEPRICLRGQWYWIALTEVDTGFCLHCAIDLVKSAMVCRKNGVLLLPPTTIDEQDRQRRCNVTQYYTFWVCVCSLRYPASKRIRCVILSLRLYNIIPHYLMNGTVFGKKLLSMKCVFSVSLKYLSEIFLILRRIQRDIIINLRRSSCKVPVILVRCDWNLNFLGGFSKNNQMWNSTKIIPVGAELFREDKRTDRQTWLSKQSLFVILLKCLKTQFEISAINRWQSLALYWHCTVAISRPAQELFVLVRQYVDEQLSQRKMSQAKTEFFYVLLTVHLCIIL